MEDPFYKTIWFTINMKTNILFSTAYFLPNNTEDTTLTVTFSNIGSTKAQEKLCSPVLWIQTWRKKKMFYGTSF